MNPDLPNTLPPCPVASCIIRRLAAAGPDYVERMCGMGKARCDICGHLNDIPRHYGDWQCSQCRQSYEYEEGHAIKLTDAQWKLLRSCRWIPVSARLPPLLTEVLGWHPQDRVRAWFRHSGTIAGGPMKGTYWETWSPQDRECDDCEVDEPTHWMPLPKPPSA